MFDEIIEKVEKLKAEAYQKGKTDAIDECKQILLDAMAREGKTKCHEYMIAINEMEQLKEQNNGNSNMDNSNS